MATGAAHDQAAAATPVTWSPAARELVGGVLAGAANVTSGYAFDTMKVRLQASPGATSMTDCFWSIWRTEGVRGFYRGLSSPLIGGAAETGVNYLIYSRILQQFRPPPPPLVPWGPHISQPQLQQLDGQLPLQPHLAAAQQLHTQPHHHYHALQQQQQQQELLPPLRAVPVAGAAAGVALSFILSPTELVKCRMQMGQASSPVACLLHILHTEGARGLCRGFGATLCREVPGNALFFTVYEGLRRTGLGGRAGGHGSSGGGSSGGGSSGGSSMLGTAWAVVQDAAGAIVCGGLAGVVMWGTVLPLDVAKTRIQTAQPGSPWDTGVLQQLRMLYREGGRRALWAGLSPTLVRAFPANACQWLAWEVAMQQLLPPAALEEASSSAVGIGEGSSSRPGLGQQLPAAAAAVASQLAQ